MARHAEFSTHCYERDGYTIYVVNTPMLSIPDEVARVVSPSRWYAMDREEQQGLLDWLYEFESMLTHADAQDAERAEDAFEGRDCFCNGGEFICSHDCYHP